MGRYESVVLHCCSFRCLECRRAKKERNKAMGEFNWAAVSKQNGKGSSKGKGKGKGKSSSKGKGKGSSKGNGKGKT